MWITIIICTKLVRLPDARVRRSSCSLADRGHWVTCTCTLANQPLFHPHIWDLPGTSTCCLVFRGLWLLQLKIKSQKTLCLGEASWQTAAAAAAANSRTCLDRNEKIFTKTSHPLINTIVWTCVIHSGLLLTLMQGIAIVNITPKMVIVKTIRFQFCASFLHINNCIARGRYSTYF